MRLRWERGIRKQLRWTRGGQRGVAAGGGLLSVSEDSQAIQLELFFEQTHENDVYAMALTLESLNDRSARAVDACAIRR